LGFGVAAFSRFASEGWWGKKIADFSTLSNT